MVVREVRAVTSMSLERPLWLTISKVLLSLTFASLQFKQAMTVRGIRMALASICEQCVPFCEHEQ